ncbi:MAG TPA: ATP-binding protein [Vicinamibacterales bacterium]|nr:ATP-binding protein [Vicinamibacterales bacterium]
MPAPTPGPINTAALLQALVESSDDAIVSKDLDGTIMSWNPAAARMFGYSPEEAIGQSIRIIIPADRQDEETAVLDSVRRGQKIEHYETIRQRKDGMTLPISLTVSPIRSDGAIIGASKIARDISDRRRMEAAAAREHVRTEFLAGLSDALPRSLAYDTTLKSLAALAVPRIADWCAIDIVAADGEIRCAALAHVDPAKAPLVEDVHCREENPNAPYSPHECIRSRAPAMIQEITDDMIVAAARGDAGRLAKIRALGRVSYICVPMAVGGRVLGALTLVMSESARRYTEADLRFAEDIAERAALVVENARSYEQLQRANRLKDDFLATLSHELRTPLNAIVGYTRMMSGGMIGGDRLSKAIETIDRNATELTRMVEDILDVSRIVSGKMRLNVQAVDLPLVIHEAVETIRPAAEAKRIRVHAVLDPQVGPISGDPDRLRQVVWNLLSNAIKFTPKEGHVQVGLERVNSSVEIIVSDNGMGIPEDFLPHLFERFRQADSSSTRQHGGLGLGLAIVRNLVELHGGTVYASSPGAGAGSTFRVRLPLRIVHDAHAEEPRMHPRRESARTMGTMPDLDGIRVLAVDDEPDSLRLLTEILEGAGAHVTTARSGAAALEKIEAADPDVLIADLGMPLMDGFQLISRIRASPNPRLRDLPAAALTAYARSEDRAKTLQGGFEMHLAKPIDPIELASAVQALGRRRT